MMKRVFFLISLAVAILVIVGNVFAQDETSNIPEPSLDPEWKLVFTGSDGTTFYVNTREITYLPGGIVKVRVLWVPRGETRRTIVDASKFLLLLKKNLRLLSKGEDPNNAERLWYKIFLVKFNCKNHQIATLEDTAYSFGDAVLDHNSSQREEWRNIVPGSVDEKLEKYVCNEAPPSIPAPHKPPIPEPSLDPAEWKLVSIGSGGGTFYFNTMSITYLPEGIVKVLTLHVPRGESREGLVSSIKEILPLQGKDPNNAERLWYGVALYKINCRTHQFALLEMIIYSFEKTVLYSNSSQYEKWGRFSSGSPMESIEKYVCK